MVAAKDGQRLQSSYRDTDGSPAISSDFFQIVRLILKIVLLFRDEGGMPVRRSESRVFGEGKVHTD